MNKLAFYVFLFAIVQNTGMNRAFGQHRSMSALDSMLNELAAAKDDTNKTKLLYHISQKFYPIDQKKYLDYTEWGLKLAERQGFNRAIAVFYGQKGIYYRDKGLYDSAFYCMNQALELQKKAGNKRGVALSLIDIGTLYDWQSDHAAALTNLLKAIPVLEEVKDYRNLVIAEKNISSIYLNQEDTGKSLHYALRALDIAKKYGVNDQMGSCYGLMASLRQKTGHLSEALLYAQRALDSYKAQHEDRGVAETYMKLSDLDSVHANKSLSYLLKAKSIWDKTAPMHPVAISNIGSIGEFYFSLAKSGGEKLSQDGQLMPQNKDKLLQLAAAYVSEALTKSKQTNAIQNVMYFYGQKALIEAERHNFKQAFFDLDKNLSLYDSLYSQQNKNKLASLTSEREIALRDKEIEVQQLRLKEFWLYGIIVLIVVISLSIYLLNRSRIKSLRLKSSLQQQKTEQQTKALIWQNKVSESELKAIRSQMNPHFIFNVLNSIESYILENDARMASRLVQKFAGLSRLILENSTQSLVPIEREWKALCLYTELEAIRYDHKFSYRFEADPALRWDSMMVPPMLVQPLIENSIHHGLRHLLGRKGVLHVNVCEENNQLVFKVDDNGIGSCESSKIKSSSKIKERSLGIAGIKDRIASINLQMGLSGMAAASLQITDHSLQAGTGVTAIIKLPLSYQFQREVLLA